MTITTVEHSKVALASIHKLHNFEYADAAARVGAVGLTVDNNYQVARQIDTNTFWILTDWSGPTWLLLDTGGATSLWGRAGTVLSPANVGDDLKLTDDTNILLGTGLGPSVGDATLGWNTTQTVDNLVLGLGTNYQGFIICESADIGFDFTHAEPANPSIWLHSQNQSTTEYLELYHNTVSAVVSSGTSLKLTAAANENISMLTVGTGIVVVGSGAGSHGLNAPGDLFVSAELEVDGPTFLDSTLDCTSLASFSNNIYIGSGRYLYNDTADYGAVLLRNTSQTLDGPFVTTGTVTNSWVVCEHGDVAFDFQHTLQVNPTWFIQSANQSTTQWGSLAHNQTSFVVSSGTSLLLQAATNENVFVTPQGTGIFVCGTGAGSHTLNAPGDAYFSGEVEIDGAVHFDGSPTFYTNALFKDSIELQFGNIGDSRVDWSTTQTNHSLIWGLGDTSKSVIFCDSADRATNFTHGNQTDPTTFRHAADVTDLTKFSSSVWNESTIGGSAGSYIGLKSIPEEITIPVGQGGIGNRVNSVLDLIPATSRIIQVVTRVTQAPGGGATTYQAGRTNGGNVNEYATAITTALNTTTIASDDGDGVTDIPHWQTAADTMQIGTDADVTISPMKVRVVVYYEEITVPTA